MFKASKGGESVSKYPKNFLFENIYRIYAQISLTSLKLCTSFCAQWIYSLLYKDGSVALWFVNVCLGATALQLDIILCNKNGKMKMEYEIC